MLVEELAVKKYLSILLEESIRKKELIDAYISDYNILKDSSIELLNDNSPYKKYITNYYKSFFDSDYLKSDVPLTNPKEPTHLIHQTYAGHMVRSKSEVIISNCLFMNKIPYKYECPLLLGDKLFYPDFTIVHPYTYEKIYWEHFGMMDKIKYRNDTYDKLKYMGDYGIIPSINLITTFETEKVPLNSNTVERIICDYFF